MRPRFPLRPVRARLAPALASALASALGLALGLALTAAPRRASAQPVTKAGAGDGVVPGVEVLLADSLHLVRGKRVGLITNHSGRDRAGRSTIDLLHRAPGVRLTALFALEHGIRGTAQDGVTIASTTDSATGIPIHSLYGAVRTPTRAMLADVDVLVYDIQDVGSRTYTYVWAMALVADSAGKPFVVLDRPNPVRADRVEGGVLDPRFRSYVGQYPVATRYGMTPGELLRYLAGTGQVRAPSITVVPMRHYRRSMWWNETGLAWVNPSPNLRDEEATTLYTGTVLVEGTNLSEGRGTDMPFKVVGAPWLTDAGAIAAELNAMRLPGVRFDSTTRAVDASAAKWGGRTIPMIRLTVTDRDAVNPSVAALRLLQVIRARHPNDLEWRATIDRLAGSDRAKRAIDAGDAAVTALLAEMERESRAFEAETRRYHLYR